MSGLNAFGVALLCVWAVGPIFVIARMGQKRDPYDKGDAIAQLLVSAAYIVLLLTVGTGS